VFEHGTGPALVEVLARRKGARGLTDLDDRQPALEAPPQTPLVGVE
jgi:predicted nicotinamide N-methyase